MTSVVTNLMERIHGFSGGRAWRARKLGLCLANSSVIIVLLFTELELRFMLQTLWLPKSVSLGLANPRHSVEKGKASPLGAAWCPHPKS